MASINDFYKSKQQKQRKLNLKEVTRSLREVKFNNMKQKVNEVRTRLLIFTDEERNKCIKNCKVLINHQNPKEIINKYSQSITVSFNNPIIRSEAAEIEQLSHRGNGDSQRDRDLKREDHEKANGVVNPENINTSNNGFKLNNAVGVFYFSKCIKEIGKEFIDQRKRNVSYKKLDREGVSSKRQSLIQIDTELSFMETINNFNSTKNRSSNKSTGKRRSEKVFTFPKSFEEIFIEKEEKEARNIQNNYNKLQELVNKLKRHDSDEGSDNNNFYKNFKNNFNEELFDILEYKGVKFDHKLISSSNVENNLYTNIYLDDKSGNKYNTESKVKFHSCVDNEMFLNNLDGFKNDESSKHLKSEMRNHPPIRSIIHPKKNSEFIPKNPFAQSMVKSDEKSKKQKTISMNEIDSEKYHMKKTNRNLFPTSKNFGSDYGLETNETTRNVSINKNKFSNNYAFYEEDGNSEENNEIYDEPIEEMQETPIGKKCILTYTYSSNKDILEFLSDNEFENRISNISNGGASNDKLEMMKTYGTNNSDKNILKLINCDNNKYDSDISKNSGSDVSRLSNSNVSKNKSDYTQMSNISELSGEFTEKNL